MKLTSIWRRLHQHSAFGANAALTAATNLALGGLGVVTGAMVARLLGPHGRGELAAIQTYPTLMGYLTMLGTDQAVVYFSARQPDRAGDYVAGAAMISLASALPFVFVAYIAMPLLLSAQAFPTVTAARWYLLVVPVIALMSLALYALRGRSDFVPWNALRMTPALAWLVILLFAWACGLRNPHLVAAAYLAALTTLLIPIGLAVKRYMPGTFAPNPRQFKPMLVYGLPCIASSLPAVANVRLDQMLMAGLLSPEALGFYVVAVAWSGAISPLMNAVGSVLFPKVAAHEAQADRFRSFSRGSRLAAMLALITTPLLAIATPWGLILLFGQNFRPAITSALILVPAGAIAALVSVIKEGFRGMGAPTAVLYAELAGLATTGVGLYLLLQPMGIVGASIASLLGYSTVMVALLIQARWLTGESPATLLLPSTEEIAAGMKQLAMLARRMVPVISRA